jgi:hypothetical protein
MEQNTLAMSLAIEIGLLKEKISLTVAEFEHKTGFRIDDISVAHNGDSDNKFGDLYIDVNLIY